MGILTNYKGRRAVMAHSKGDLAEARKLYEEVYAEGIEGPTVLLPYSILLLRVGEYEKAKEVLRKVEKSPKPLSPEQRAQMLTHYAVASWKTGRLDYAIGLLKEVQRKNPNGTNYGTLGFLLIEQGDLEEALAFNQEAVEYDEEDAVALDNLAQVYYRLAGDKEEALKWFKKAYKEKEGAIDTNYFLAQYDIEAGNVEAAREKLNVALEGRFSPLNYATPELIREALAKLPAEADADEED